MSTTVIQPGTENRPPTILNTEDHVRDYPRHDHRLDEAILNAVNAGTRETCDARADLLGAARDVQAATMSSVERAQLHQATLAASASERTQDGFLKVLGASCHTDELVERARGDLAQQLGAASAGIQVAFKEQQTLLTYLDGRQQLEASKNTNLLTALVDRHAAATQLRETEHFASMKELVRFEASETRRLVDTNEKDRLRERLATLERQAMAHYSAQRVPVCP